MYLEKPPTNLTSKIELRFKWIRCSISLKSYNRENVYSLDHSDSPCLLGSEKCIAQGHRPCVYSQSSSENSTKISQIAFFLRKLRCCLCGLLSPPDMSLLAVTVADGDTLLPQSASRSEQEGGKWHIHSGWKFLTEDGGCWQPERAWDPKKWPSTLDQSTPFSFVFSFPRFFQSMTRMTLNSWKSLQRKLNKLILTLFTASLESPCTRRKHTAVRTQGLRGRGLAPRAPPWAVLASGPGCMSSVPSGAREVWPAEVPWTLHGLRNLVSSWHTHHAPGQVGKVWKGERRGLWGPQQCSMIVWKSPSLLFSLIPSGGRTRPSNCPRTGRDLRLAGWLPFLPSSHLLLRQGYWGIIYTQWNPLLFGAQTGKCVQMDHHHVRRR